MRIRRADLGDSGALADLRWQWASENGPPPVDRDAFREHVATWQAEHEHTHRPFLALSDDGEPIGMAWIATLPRVPDPAAMHRVGADLQSVYVLPHLRGQGVGEALVAAILEVFRDEGLEMITVSSSRLAVPLYERAGFAVSPQLLRQHRRES